MTTSALGLLLLLVCVLASSAVIAVGYRRVGTRDDGDRFLRIAAVAGLSTVGSVVLELFFIADPSVALRAAADAAVALGPATAWLAIRSLRGGLRVPALVALGGTASVAAASTIVARPGSFGFLLAVLGVFCVLALIEVRRGPLRRVRGQALLSSALTVLVVYCSTVLAVALIAGDDSSAYRILSSGPVWTAMSCGVIVAAAVAATLIVRNLRPRGIVEPPTTTGSGRRARVSIPDFALLPAAFGLNAAAFLDDQLLRAARECDPAASAVGPGACELVSTEPPSEVERRLQARFADLATAADAVVVGDLVIVWPHR